MRGRKPASPSALCTAVWRTSVLSLLSLQTPRIPPPPVMYVATRLLLFDCNGRACLVLLSLVYSMLRAGLLHTVPSFPGPALPSTRPYNQEEQSSNGCNDGTPSLVQPPPSPLSESCRASERANPPSSSSPSLPGTADGRLYFAKHIEPVVSSSAPRSKPYKASIDGGAGGGGVGRFSAEECPYLLPGAYSYLCEVGLSTCHALAHRFSAPCQCASPLHCLPPVVHEEANAQRKEEESKLAEKRKKAREEKEDSATEEDLYLGSDLERR